LGTQSALGWTAQISHKEAKIQPSQEVQVPDLPITKEHVVDLRPSESWRTALSIPDHGVSSKCPMLLGIIKKLNANPKEGNTMVRPIPFLEKLECIVGLAFGLTGFALYRVSVTISKADLLIREVLQRLRPRFKPKAEELRCDTGSLISLWPMD
jgi:hypothetical protein